MYYIFMYSVFLSVREIASTNLFRVYSLIFSDFVDFSGVFIACKYFYSLLKSSWSTTRYVVFSQHINYIKVYSYRINTYKGLLKILRQVRQLPSHFGL